MIALYLRLSFADGDLGKNNKDESNSIESQRILLREFVRSRNDLSQEIKEYVDDGYSGTNFDRPGFKEMLEDAKHGIIDTIIVKDLSRLGRDYIGVGDYLEQIFPVLRIRFIAVNSNYDSKNYDGKTMGLDMSFSNLVNSFYSKDISKKYKSAIRTKWKKGISTSGRVPFGYMKDENNKSKWVIDPEAAMYVRMIFLKAIEGNTTSQIADLLNEMGVPTPGAYLELHSDYKQWNRKVRREEWLWDRRKVWTILKRYKYTGALVQGETQLIGVGSKIQRAVPKSEQVIVDGVHDAIVTIEEFELAQKAIRNQGEKSYRGERDYPLRSKIRCGNCGLRMGYKDGANPVFFCAHSVAAGNKSECDRTRYLEKDIEAVVWQTLHEQLQILKKLELMVEKKQAVEPGITVSQLGKWDRDIETLKAEKVRQYEIYAEGNISKEMYLAKKRRLMSEIDSLQKESEKMRLAYESQQEILNGIKGKRESAQNYLAEGRLTRELVDAFIDTVYIYNPKCIEVVFSFEDLIQNTYNWVEDKRKAIS